MPASYIIPYEGDTRPMSYSLFLVRVVVWAGPSRKDHCLCNMEMLWDNRARRICMAERGCMWLATQLPVAILGGCSYALSITRQLGRLIQPAMVLRSTAAAAPAPAAALPLRLYMLPGYPDSKGTCMYGCSSCAMPWRSSADRVHVVKLNGQVANWRIGELANGGWRMASGRLTGDGQKDMPTAMGNLGLTGSQPGLSVFNVVVFSPSRVLGFPEDLSFQAPIPEPDWTGS
ncbi:hypothetical protein F5Y12DRAFT_484088 [Xylaria sp. FL1777]|nr:hypothetical protein F5Y12DRAFT_484088 [Xylaria sp. FL1777]